MSGDDVTDLSRFGGSPVGLVKLATAKLQIFTFNC